MPRIARAFFLLSIIALLAACASSGPPKRVWPPQASLQELAVLEDGTWQLGVRLQNFSTVAMNFDQASLELRISGQAAGQLALTPRLRIGPGSTDIVTLRLPPDFDAAGLVADALQTRSGIRYRLQGHIVTSDPNGRHASEFESVLTPVPGLPGVLR